TSPDFSHARVFVSVLGSEEENASSLKALNAGATFMRRELRGRLKSLRHVPELSFKADHSIERGAQLTALLNQVAHEHDAGGVSAQPPRPTTARARASGRRRGATCAWTQCRRCCASASPARCCSDRPRTAPSSAAVCRCTRWHGAAPRSRSSRGGWWSTTCG